MSPTEKKIFNHNVNHIGISVPDIDAAVKWYTSALGFRQLRSHMVAIRKSDPDSPIFKVFDGALQECKVAFLAAGNGVGIELFEFINPKYKGPKEPITFEEKNYVHGGFFHIAFTAPEPDELCERVVEAGGKKIGDTVLLGKGEYALYLQDPWGNVIEVMSCTFEQMLANQEGFP